MSEDDGKNDDDKKKVADALRARLTERLAPLLLDPRNRLRTVVAAKVLSIVNREIGQGQPRLESEWASLKQTVAGQPGAAELVASLETALKAYADELQARVAAGELGEPEARAAAVKVIQLGLLRKLGLLDPVPEG
jgi:hypothetical protein